MNNLLATVVVVVVSGMSGAIGVELIRTWRDKTRLDAAWLYPVWQSEMAAVRQELSDLRELVIALSDEVTSLGGDPTKVRVELARQQRERAARRNGEAS